MGKVDRSKLNVNGSSLAAGHPFAATGGRIVASLAKMLHAKGASTGVPRGDSSPSAPPAARASSRSSKQQGGTPMTDKYAQLVSRGFGKDLARRLGLPQPAVLRRYEPGAPLITGPVLVAVTAAAPTSRCRPAVWGLDVRRNALPKEKLGAIVLVLDAIEPRPTWASRS